MIEHRCANCWVAQYQIKSDVPCRNEWWLRWDAEHIRPSSSYSKETR